MPIYTRYMKYEDRESYKKGYLTGYRAGYVDGKNGKSEIQMESDTAACPLEVMGLSTRAYNCLYRAGCRCAGDVAQLTGTQIQQMRNLGKVTAGEIAGVLENLGIHGTDWGVYSYWDR